MSQHIPPLDPPSNTQSRALGPQDTNSLAPNISPSPSFPYPQPSNGTYAIAWIFSGVFDSSMTYPQQMVRERALFCVVVDGLEANKHPVKVETDGSPPDPKRQKLSDQSEPKPHCSVTVQLCSKLSWVKYRTVYEPLHSNFGPLIPISFHTPGGVMTAPELIQRLQSLAPRMRFRRTLADDGERFLEVIMKGIDGYEQEEYSFICKKRTITGGLTVGMECMLSDGEFMRLYT